MSRLEHTKRITTLLEKMVEAGENVIKDYGLRSTEEQNRLYRIGRMFDQHGNLVSEDKTKTVTYCDGYVKVSGHQLGLADDILFLSDDHTKLADPKKGWNYWHLEWDKLGGLMEIDWDLDHFESPK